MKKGSLVDEDVIIEKSTRTTDLKVNGWGCRKERKKESKPIELFQGTLLHTFSEATKAPLKVKC